MRWTLQIRIDPNSVHPIVSSSASRSGNQRRGNTFPPVICRDADGVDISFEAPVGNPAFCRPTGHTVPTNLPLITKRNEGPAILIVFKRAVPPEVSSLSQGVIAKNF